ncbi:MAG: glycoside hydrolase/phage tail family protein [Pseudomonadota bacterium]
MATVVLSLAGAAAGSSLGGSVLGLSALTLGRAAGAIAGTFIDQAVLGTGSAAVETGRARSLRIQSSTEGAPMPQCFGRVRLAGQLIWASRFLETVRNTTRGGKATGGGQRVREFSYSISFAVGLCEGPIERIGRVWADGKLLDLTGVNYRIYHGTEEQIPDPKIEAVEGAGRVPAYRGVAYVVFEDLPVGQFGNRIPQLNFEVFRNASATVDGVEAGTPLPELVKAVCLSPGTGDFALDPEPSRIVFPAGGGRYANINNTAGVPDFQASLDQMDHELPGTEQISLVVSWFGDDLRVGRCRVEPKIEERNRVTAPEPWSAAGLTTANAPLISRTADDRPNFGGTPDDKSIVRAIEEMQARGKKVTLYPFLLMDIPASNGLSDPYGRPEQPPFPWRGRITLDLAPDQQGTQDQTEAAASDVDAFFGSASAADFSINDGTVVYNGPQEWTWRRFVLHMAALGAAAGGVEAICIGTELRGITTIRSARTEFPAVDHLIALAEEVRTLLPNVKITYAADWSEYFGYQPQDGSGDVLFHLDPLWADPNIDLIGIDDYTPLSDWRHGLSHADEGAGSIYSLPYLQSQIEGGEYYDYFYASEADQIAQARTPITDGAHNEPWIFRPKDIRNWWSNPHHNRVGGVRDAQPTAWVPESKPVWLTETGCPAVDLGANKPNLFVDPKSSESALPPGSRGARDDEMQRRFLQAKLGYWAEPGNNPVSAVYAGPMIPDDGVFVWTWDARPWPDFPVREGLWADGPSHRLGHWVTGRVTAGSLAEVVTEICARSGLGPDDINVSRLFGVVDGYTLEHVQSAREAMQPLMQAYGFEAFESDGRITFATRQLATVTPIDPERLLPGSGPDRAAVERVVSPRTQSTDAVRLSYVQTEAEYRVGAAQARLPGGDLLRVSETSLNLSLPSSRAQQIADRWLAEQLRSQETASFQLPPSALAFQPGDVLQLQGAGQTELYRLDRVTDLGAREAEAVRVEPSLYVPVAAADRSLPPQSITVPGPLTALILDLPLADGSETDHQPRLAVSAEPWPGDVAVYKSASGEGFDLAASVRKPALLGFSDTPLSIGAPNRWHRVDWDVFLPTGGIAAEGRLEVLNGANRLAVQMASGAWEILQFRDAELIGQDHYRLGYLLRGQRGTDALSVEPIPEGARIVVLDDALVPLPVSAEEIGLPRTWRVGPAQFDISHPGFVELTGTAGAVGLRPFAPAHLRARSQGADLAISWIRQTRMGGDSFVSVEVPLGEEREAYRLTVRSGDIVLRTVEVSEPALIYTASDQAADGASGAISVSVAQLSATYGYGPERTIEIHV